MNYEPSGIAFLGIKPKTKSINFPFEITALAENLVTVISVIDPGVIITGFIFVFQL